MIKPSKSTKKKNTYAIRRATEQQLKEARELEQRIKREADDAKRVRFFSVPLPVGRDSPVPVHLTVLLIHTPLCLSFVLV